MQPIRLARIAILSASLPLLAGLAPDETYAQDWTYLDDRSSPQRLIESYYFAISTRSYAQAYGYFEAQSAPEDFNIWVKGYAGTKSVEVKFGSTQPDPGAGQIYWALPVALLSLQTNGTRKTYTGCYKIHMTNPGMQVDPPYQPMGIVSASLTESKTPYMDAQPGPC